MAWLWWGLSVCFGSFVLLLVIVVGAIVWFAVVDHRMTQRTIREGERGFAWLVQANVALFEEGERNLPALVIFSRNVHTNNDEHLMTSLAAKLMDLKGVDPAVCTDEDDAWAAKYMSSEKYIEGSRSELPKRLARGHSVYLLHIYDIREHLPGKRLTGRRVPCAVMWNDPKAPISTFPM